MGDDDAKRLILARRARFVAAALASVAGIAGGDACAPAPCLEPAPPADGGSGDAAGRDAGANDEPGRLDGAAEPQPCLTIAQDAESK